MGKTKRSKRKNKTKKVKRGGRKQNMALQTTQMMGGVKRTQHGGVQKTQYGGVGEPSPAPLTLLGTYDEESVIEALQSFGNATAELERAVKTGADTSIALKEAVEMQETALNTLKTVAETLNRSVTSNEVANTGLFKKIVGTDFVETPGPAPAEP